MQIIFSRHGESGANVLREISNRGLVHPLTLRGREQANALADLLQDVGVTRIYGSPVLRAIETAVVLAHRLDVEYEIVDALREVDMGIYEGRADEIAWENWQAIVNAWIQDKAFDQRIETGESFHELRKRFVPFIERLVREYGATDAKIVCVAHGGLLWMMLLLVLKNVDTAFIEQHNIHYTTRIVAEPRHDGLYCVEWNGQQMA